MSACSVHIHIHKNKAVLLLFCLCFLGDNPVSLSLFPFSSQLHHLLCHLNPQKQHCIPISCFSILVTSSRCSFVHAHEYGAWKILAFGTSSASLVFRSSLVFGVLICATKRIPFLGFSSICLRFGADMCGFNLRMLRL